MKILNTLIVFDSEDLLTCSSGDSQHTIMKVPVKPPRNSFKCDPLGAHSFYEESQHQAIHVW